MNVTADAWMVIENLLETSLKLEAGVYYNSCDFLEDTRVMYCMFKIHLSTRGEDGLKTKLIDLLIHNIWNSSCGPGNCISLADGFDIQ